MRASAGVAFVLVGLLGTPAAHAFIAYTSNERDNTMSVVDIDQGKVIRTVETGQRPRGILVTPDGKNILVADGDDDEIQIFDSGSLQVVRTIATPDPELFALRPTGNPLYVSNENDAVVTVWDVNTTKRLASIPTGVEPEGMDVSPDGETIVNTSEVTNMAHFIDYKSQKMVASVPVDARPRNARFKHDGSEVWISSELGGTVSVIDPKLHKVTHKISFPIQGLRAQEVQPEDIRFTKDDKSAFVALGPANRVAVVDATKYEVKKYLLVGARVWHLGFTPDYKQLLTANGLSNDISVIDVPDLTVTRSIPVGQQPWGVVVNPASKP
jgi:PQQ-dependent catabolism-associated beta-propeller protein